MQIEMGGRTALLVGSGGAVEVELTQMLVAAGATVASAADVADGARHREIDTLIVFSPPVPAADLVAHSEQLAEALASRRGRILVVTSAQALIPVRADWDANLSAVAALAATRTLAMTLAERGICVNALALATVGADEPGLVSHTALLRAGTPKEAAAAALFLIDPQNTYMTGQILAADGGWSASYIRDF